MVNEMLVAQLQTFQSIKGVGEWISISDKHSETECRIREKCLESQLEVVDYMVELLELLDWWDY